MLQQIAAVIFSLSVANLLRYSHGLGSSSEWVCLFAQNGYVANNLRAQYSNELAATTLYFHSSSFSFFVVRGLWVVVAGFSGSWCGASMVAKIDRWGLLVVGSKGFG